VVDPGILGFPCSLNSRVLTFCSNTTFLCKLRGIRVLGAQRNSCIMLMSVLIGSLQDAIEPTLG